MTRSHLVYVAAGNDKGARQQIEIVYQFLRDQHGYIGSKERVVEITEGLCRHTYVEHKRGEGQAPIRIISTRADLSGRSGPKPDEKIKEILKNEPLSVIIPTAKQITSETVSNMLKATKHVALAEAGVEFTRGATPEYIEAVLAALKSAGRTEDGREILDPDYDGGRPPIGTTVENSRLVKTDEFDDVCTILHKVDRGELSQQSAARELDCARATIRNILEDKKRRALYLAAPL